MHTIYGKTLNQFHLFTVLLVVSKQMKDLCFEHFIHILQHYRFIKTLSLYLLFPFMVISFMVQDLMESGFDSPSVATISISCETFCLFVITIIIMELILLNIGLPLYFLALSIRSCLYPAADLWSPVYNFTRPSFIHLCSLPNSTCYFFYNVCDACSCYFFVLYMGYQCQSQHGRCAVGLLWIYLKFSRLMWVFLKISNDGENTLVDSLCF